LRERIVSLEPNRPAEVQPRLLPDDNWRPVTPLLDPIAALPPAFEKVDAVVVAAKVPPPELETLNLLTPANCASIRFPVNPLAALTPSPVPLVDHPVEVVPVGSIKIYGFVVVAEPPVIHVPSSFSAGPSPVDSAPLTVE
jgi:hypothetical protein